jgi:D-threo-aldose 1-dehydrogenase
MQSASSLIKDRRIGATDVTVPNLGFGAAAIGNLYQALTDEACAATVRAALDAQIGYFDTAPHYGFGLSEMRLGEALRLRSERPAEIRVSTKVGRKLVPTDSADRRGERHGFVDARPFEPVFDYSYDGVMRSFEESLLRLNTDRIDILLAHDLGATTHGERHPEYFRQFLAGGYAAMRRLKEDGRIGAIGLGVNEIEICLQLLADADIDCILLAGRYTLLEQDALNLLFPACRQRQVSVIVGGPYNSGILVEQAQGGGPRHYNYGAAPPHITERVEAMSRICADHGIPLPAAALQFPLAHPCVASVIPGMGSVKHVDDTLRFLSFDIPNGLWSDLKDQGLIRPDAPVPTRGRT